MSLRCRVFGVALVTVLQFPREEVMPQSFSFARLLEQSLWLQGQDLRAYCNNCKTYRSMRQQVRAGAERVGEGLDSWTRVRMALNGKRPHRLALLPCPDTYSSALCVEPARTNQSPRRAPVLLRAHASEGSQTVGGECAGATCLFAGAKRWAVVSCSLSPLWPPAVTRDAEGGHAGSY